MILSTIAFLSTLAYVLAVRTVLRPWVRGWRVNPPNDGHLSKWMTFQKTIK